MEKNSKKANEMKVATLATVNKTVLTISNTLSKMLPVQVVKTLAEADAVLQAADKITAAVEQRADYARCKLLAFVKDNELYKPTYDNFEKWVTGSHSYKYKQALAKAKAAALINEGGDGSILPHTTKNDFSISKLTMFIESGLTVEELKELCEKDYFTPAMPDTDIRKQLKKLKAKDITDGASGATDGASGATDGASGATDGASGENLELVKTDILKVSFDKYKAEKLDNIDGIPQGAFVIVVYNDEISKVYYNKGKKAVAAE